MHGENLKLNANIVYNHKHLMPLMRLSKVIIKNNGSILHINATPKFA